MSTNKKPKRITHQRKQHIHQKYQIHGRYSQVIHVKYDLLTNKPNTIHTPITDQNEY